jgi:N-acetylglutamate synthase
MNCASAYTVRAFSPVDIGPALAFWTGIEGLGLTESDNEASIHSFLNRNPGFSGVATSLNEEIVGTVLCGHNGRAGFLYHLAVHPQHRRQGLGGYLVEHCIARLAEAAIPRCNIFVYTANNTGNQFWLRRGWHDPTTWKVFQKLVT